MNQDILDRIQGPSRFLGNEVNSVPKDFDRASARVGLIFPDAYDLGMSHLGYKIVYHALNREADIVCHRAFAPEPDVEAAIRAAGQGLTALESDRPLAEFDLLGFSLPHEMAATNVLTVLDLAGLPLKSAERTDDQPIVLAGGPAAFTPEPLADFFDAFFLGDGEEAVVELARLVGRAKREGLGRAEILARLAEVDGIYIPAFFEPRYQDGQLTDIAPQGPVGGRVIRRVLPDLETAFFPTAQLVPYGKPVHDRLTVELGRGCTRGCRFCQAGMLYRPVRERSPETIYRLALESLRQTGYDEMSLLALSAGDYSCIEPLMISLIDRLDTDRVSLSLPSLRVDSLSGPMAELISRIRVTGFTLAPEAGSDRLRAVINKNITEEQIITAAKIARKFGWRLLKLYFMIGLPTETEADRQALVDLVAAIGRAVPGMNLNVSLSPFVPKAHTPFQWDRQLEAAEVEEIIGQIKRRLRPVKGVRVKWNSAVVAQLEGILSRGDRRVGRVIERAWRAGARFDAWSDYFRWEFWAEALAAEGLEPGTYLAPIPTDRVLAWDHLPMVNKSFLLAERDLALKAEQSPDCRHGQCLGCGVCDFKTVEPKTVEGQTVTAKPVTAGPGQPRRVGFHYRKVGPARYLGHLELASLFQRAFRRAGIRLGYSQGFHPQPKLSFFEALPVGAESLDEYAQVEILDDHDLKTLLKRLDSQLPAGLELTALAQATKKNRPEGAIYRVSLAEETARPPGPEPIEEFLAALSVPHERHRPGKTQRFDLRPAVKAWEQVYPGQWEMTIVPPAQGPTPRPDEVVGVVLGLPPEQLRVLKIKTLMTGG